MRGVQVLFSAGDLAAAGLIDYLLRRQAASAPARQAAMLAWLFNPFTMTISTRGSCDVLCVLLLLALLAALLHGRVLASGLLYGLAVHFRIYPVIYGPAAVLYLTQRRLCTLQVRKAPCALRLAGSLSRLSAFRLPPAAGRGRGARVCSINASWACWRGSA